MIQVRPSTGGDTRYYAPDRDLAYAFPTLVRGAAVALTNLLKDDSPDYRWMGAWTSVFNVSLDELAEATSALARFIGSVSDSSVTDFNHALHRSGFFNASVNARMAILAIIGCVTTRAHFHAIRSILEPNEAPKANLETLGDVEADLKRFIEEWRAKKSQATWRQKVKSWFGF